jgi:hypothetical protein
MTDLPRAAIRALAGPVMLLGALFVLIPSHAQVAEPEIDSDPILDRVRTDFYRAIEDPAVADELRSRIETELAGDWQEYPQSIAGYYAAVEGLQGKHSTAVRAKIGYVQGAIAKFQYLAQRYPQALEIRFLRYSFYEQLPPVFGVSQYVGIDLDAVISLLGQDDGWEGPVTVRRDMIEYILGTAPPDAQQRKVLEELLSQ